MRYFFHLINGHGRQEDSVGQELAGKAQVEREVSRILTDVARDELPNFSEGRVVVDVRTADAKAVCNGKLVFETNWFAPS